MIGLSCPFQGIGPDGNEYPARQRTLLLAGTVPAQISLLVAIQANLIEPNHFAERRSRVCFRQARPILAHSRIFYGAPGKFAPFASQAKTPMGSYHAKVAFCIEACILEPLQVRSNAPRSALDAVRLFYTYITRYQQLGIPHGRAKKALWPLLSKRLAQQLDSLKL